MFQNKVIVITGGANGIGKCIAEEFKKQGAHVCVIDCAEGDHYVGDIADKATLEDFARTVTQKYGKVDVLVNNAGGGLSIKPIEEQSEEMIDAILRLNLNSVMYAANVFVPDMKKRHSGTIINISSVCATHAWADWSVYAAAKAGVLNFTKGLQVELQPHGVRATCIIPASASTGFQAASGIGETQDSLQCEDIAGAVYYAATLPERAIVEEMTVWGMSQTVQPL